MQNIPCSRPIPHEPGVYIYKDAAGEIIYIGKAKDLKKRVSSYFAKKKRWDKVAALVKKIASVDFVVVDSEEEAILLESNMIKEHYPKYNVSLRDNSPLTYALITNEQFPRLLIVRKDRQGKIRAPAGTLGKAGWNGKNAPKGVKREEGEKREDAGGGEYEEWKNSAGGKIRKDAGAGKVFGPFMSGSGKSLVMGILRKAFKIRTCGSPMPKKVCLQFHLGNCAGPCEGKVWREEYMQGVGKVAQILSNKANVGKYLDEMEEEMRKAAEKKNFEKAMQIRNAWRALAGMAGRAKVDDTADKDEDYIVIIEDEGKARVQAWKMLHGVIRDRQKYEFEYVLEDALSEFLQRYYEKHPVPRNIFVNKMPEGAGALEAHLSRVRGGAAHLQKFPSRGSRAEIGALIEKNILLEKSGGADLALVRLQRELNLPKIPYVIECFDVSNLRNENLVASMVQFVNAAPKKSEYRKFKIRTVEGQDDFASMREAVFRRYRRLRDEGGAMPDMVLVDGGLGQLHAAKNALEQLDLQLPLFSLAKKEEEIYGEEFLAPLRLAKNNEALHVLQRARDEAHRFAINYGRKLKRKRNIEKAK